MMWIPEHIGASLSFEPSQFKVSAAVKFLFCVYCGMQ